MGGGCDVARIDANWPPAASCARSRAPGTHPSSVSGPQKQWSRYETKLTSLMGSSCCGGGWPECFRPGLESSSRLEPHRCKHSLGWQPDYFARFYRPRGNRSVSGLCSFGDIQRRKRSKPRLSLLRGGIARPQGCVPKGGGNLRGLSDAFVLLSRPGRESRRPIFNLTGGYPG